MKNKENKYSIVSFLVFFFGIFGFLNLNAILEINKSSKFILTLIFIASVIFISIKKYKNYNFLKKSAIFILSVILSYAIIYKNEISIIYSISKGRLNLTELSYKNDKKIILVDLYHISTKQYFNKLNSKLDSLSSLGYVLFYEKIIDTINGDKQLEENGKTLLVAQVQKWNTKN